MSYISSYSAEYVFCDPSYLSASETTFNHAIVWPFLEAITISVNGLHFVPGEVRLAAIQNCNEYGTQYNADGVIRDLHDNELLLLETSGPYNNIDKARHGFDHVKGAFGCRSIFHHLHKYRFADYVIVKKLQIFFVHARGQFFNYICSRNAANIWF